MSDWNVAARRWPLPQIRVSRETAIRVAGMLAFATGTLLLLDFINDGLGEVYSFGAGLRVNFPLAIAVVLALVFVNTRYADFSSLLKASLRASAVGILVMLLIEKPDYSLGNPENISALNYIEYGYWAGLACAAAGVFRPAFVIPAVVYIASTRYLAPQISGMYMSWLDIRYMLDMALYLAVFGIFVVKVAPRIPRIGEWLGSTDRQMEIVGVGFGLHLANYFWSGMAKVLIGPTPWYWIFDNATQNQIPYTLESGILPIGQFPWLTQFAYDVFAFTHVPLNAAIVIAQIFAVICVLKVSWLKIASVMYDILHIGIYVLGGLFFWPWVWNNITVWWAARSSKQGLTLNTKVACITAVLLGFPALGVNSAAWLAWFDVADARQVSFEAITKDGRHVKVPSAFFNSNSYAISHGYVGEHRLPGQYDGTMLASSGSLERNTLSGSCADPDTLTPEMLPKTPEQQKKRTEALAHFLKFNHDKMLAREASVGRGSWYFHAHHHPSNPFLYSEFNALSLKDVIGYNLVMESSCMSMKDGHVQKKVLKRDTEYYDVR